MIALLISLMADPVSGQAPDTPPAPSGRANDLVTGLGLDLEVNNDKPKVTLSLGGVWLEDRTPTGPDGLSQRFDQVRWSVKAAAPIGGDDDLSDPQTLDRLSNGSTLSFATSYFTFTTRDEGVSEDLSPALQFGAEAKVGVHDYDYREPVTLTERGVEETAWAVEGYVAYYPRDGRSMLSGSVTYQDAHEAQDETILCRPVVVVPADDCAQAPPGPPTHSEGILLAAEYRRTFSLGWSFGELAVSPKATFDTTDDDYGFELPVYLVPLGKSPILPGIKVGYSSEDDEVVFGLFLKSSFSLGR